MGVGRRLVWYVGVVLVGFFSFIFFFFHNPLFLGTEVSSFRNCGKRYMLILIFLLYFCILCLMSLDTSHDWHQLHISALLAHPFVVTLLLCVMNPPSLPISVLCFSSPLFYQISAVISLADI